MTTLELIHETLELRLAFNLLADHVCTRPVDKDTVDLDTVLSGVNSLGLHRSAALLYGHQHTETLDEAHTLAIELRAWLERGHRPRSLAAVGVTRAAITTREDRA